MLSERRGSFRPQPKGTVPYTVQSSDSLEGIAARYNITPSELVTLNKISSRFVFPGQIIYIPEKNSLQALEQIIKISAAAVGESSDVESPKPGHVERVPSVEDKMKSVSCDQVPEIKALTTDLPKNSEDLCKESLRINSKYVTDGEGVVSGVLIVTTNHVMFDPNVSDPLVIEYGMDKYGVEAPMSCIVRAALYTDIFRIRHDANSDKNSNLYHSKNLPMKKSKSHNDKLTKNDKSKQGRRYSSAELASRRSDFGIAVSKSFQDSLSKISESTGQEEEESESSSPNKSSLPIAIQSSTPVTTSEELKDNQKALLSNSSSFDSDVDPPSRKASISDEDILGSSSESHSPKKKSNFEKTKHKLHKGLKKLSITDSLFSHPPGGGRRMSLPAFSSLPDFKLKSPSAKSPPVEKPKPVVNQEKPVAPAYVNMVDEKPELFAPLDKLIPRPATSFCDTPLYLCLRMGEPIEKSVIRTNPVVHFGQKTKPEYWFSIPKDNVDSLYCFFLRWCPEKYGDIDKINFEELGFFPIEPEYKEESEGKGSHPNRRASWAFPWRRKSKDVGESQSTSSLEDWELLDCLRIDAAIVHPPELLTPSTILNDDQLLEISKSLPPRAMNSWTLIYGSASHGFSLKTMYREMAKYDCPILIVIENRNSIIFGAYLTSPLKMSDHFYGTGESFLFTFHPEYKVYHWSGENEYFIKGNVDSFMVGSSEGHFGLWLDDDLFRGCTNSCQTFGNDPLCPVEDFEVKAVEAWGFK
ncbi:oxidation resistance protein 1-like isoform X2 [Uloborus diversus]|nr:oxidation resistance protein 1-like isoform X2 [Uloborus diversus]